MSGTITTFNIGRDSQLVVLGPYGQIDLEHVTGFESRQITASIRVNKMDGTQIGAELPKGWEGSFELERGNSTADDFIAQAEAAFYNGSFVPAGAMYQYVNETDGSVSTYQYNSVVFKLANAGAWRGDASVKQKLEFFATTRQRL
ncbi:MAG TPA: hypothetical protein VJY39_17010 [Acidisphaera sp.]|nr:hypothetical protein [Acidisphaera sp.]